MDQLEDIEYFVHTLTDILECISSDEMKQMRINNYEAYCDLLTNKYAQFSDRHSTLFHNILTDHIDSMEQLIYMLGILAQVKTGKMQMDTANAIIREKLSSEYIYPQFGGKDAFEKTIKKRAAKKKLI
jgi:hypothetical protein